METSGDGRSARFKNTAFELSEMRRTLPGCGGLFHPCHPKGSSWFSVFVAEEPVKKSQRLTQSTQRSPRISQGFFSAVSAVSALNVVFFSRSEAGPYVT